MRAVAKILRARASEHSSNFCEQFEQRPNFASTFKFNETIQYPSHAHSKHCETLETNILLQVSRKNGDQLNRNLSARLFSFCNYNFILQPSKAKSCTCIPDQLNLHLIGLLCQGFLKLVNLL